jgi:hypothetical protein
MSSPTGYEAGTGFVQVLPSFRYFHKRIAAELARVGDVTIDGELNLSTKQAETAVAAMDTRISKVPVVKTVDVDLDRRIYDAKMVALLAKRDEKLLRIDADISAALAKISALENKRGNTTIDVDAEIAKAEAKIRSLEATRDTVVIDVDVDSNKAEDKLRRVNAEVNRIRNNNQADINIGAGDASRAIALLGGLTVALSVVGQVAPVAAAAVAAIPTAIFAAAQGIGVLMAGLSGISDATKALQAAQDESATSGGKAAAKQVASVNRVASAHSALERALEQADRSAIQSAHQVTEAREAVADAQVTATRRVEDAEQSLAHAQVAAQDAQEALTRARKDAVENLADLNRSVKGAALDEQAAMLAVEKANERLAAARAANVGGRQMQEIQLAADQAAQSLDEVRDRYGDLADEAAAANQAGVDGSREVVSAQRESGEATQRVQDAERDLTVARTDGARDVAKAQLAVAEAQQQASWAASDASHQVADAQRAIGAAAQSAGDTGSAAMNKLGLTMSKLSPAGQQFALFLQNSVKPSLQDIGAAAQTTMLPKVQYAFDRLLTLAPMVEQAFADTGDVIGDLAIKGAELVTSGPWREDFGSIVARNNRILGMLGMSGLSALDAIRSLTVASGPFVESLVASTEASLDQFNAWIQGKRETGELQAWFAEMSVRVKEFFSDIAGLAGGVWNLLQALAPLGRVILDIVVPIVQFIGAIAEANPALTATVAIAVLAGSAFLSLFRTFGQVRQAVSTSTGVYQDMKTAVFGTAKATDDAAAAAGRNATSTQAMGAAAERSGGLVGRLRGGLDGVRASYERGSGAASAFALRATSAVNDVTSNITGRLVPATATAGRAMETNFLPATQRVGAGFTAFSGTAQLALSNVAGKVGGTAAALTKGLGGAVGGLVGALGGPFGLAIAGVTAGLGFLAASQAEAAQKAAEHKAQIQGLTDALVESGGAIDDNVRKQIRLQLGEKEVADNAGHLGLSLGEMIRAVAEGGKAAEDFEGELFGVADVLAKNRGLPPQVADALKGLANQVYITGGQASDFGLQISALGDAYQGATGATDEQTEAFRHQITEFLDLVGGYKNAKGDFATSAQGQKDIAQAQQEAASATENHFNNLKKLNDAVLGSINKDLAYRQAQNGLAEAHQRVADVLADENHTTEELTAAQLSQEQAALQVIQSAGDLALANSTANTEAGRQKDSTIAQAQAAIDLANKWQGPLPASLQTYLDKMYIAKDETGQYIMKLDEVPDSVPTTAIFDDSTARQGIVNYGNWMKTYLGDLLGQNIPGYTPSGASGPVSMGGLLGLEPLPKARGGIVVPAYATGGIRPMSGKRADIVSPNTPRLIGDRMRGNEAFIPINRSPSSVAILADAATQMGFGLVPLAAGALLAMAAGGVNVAADTSAATTAGQAALSLDVSAVDGFTAAVQALIVAGLVPLASEITTTTTAAMVSLEDHAGVLAVAAVATLASQLPPLRAAFAVTAAAIGASWWATTQASMASVNTIGAYLSVLRSGMDVTRGAMKAFADWALAQFARIPAAAADPIRWVLNFPINAGLIAAWNRLNGDFAMGKPVAPVQVPFAEGGRVHGVGNEDKVRALLTPGEIVFDRLAIANLGGVAAVERLRQLARAGVIGGDQRLGGNPGDGAARLKLMRTVPMDGLGFAYGGVQPHVAAAGAEIESKFGRLPGGIGGVGSRPNVSDHPLGLALDLMTMRDVPLGNRIAGYLIQNAQRLAVKYLIWQQKMNEGSGWEGMEDRGSPTANHMDHVHTSFLRLGQAGKPFNGEGAALDPAAYFADTYNLLSRVPALFPGNIAGERAAAVATAATDAVVKYADTAASMGGTTGNVESWRPLVMQALRMLNLSPAWADITLKRMNQESGGNPRAINLTDSNAKRGDPSKGLMQVISGTFRAYRDARAPDDVWDPLANILSSMKYAMSRYGSLPAAYGRAGGYDDGGYLPPGYSTVYNGLNRPEVVLTDNQWKTMHSLVTQDAAGGGDFRGNLYLSTGEFLGAVEGVIDRANTESGRVLSRRTR